MSPSDEILPPATDTTRLLHFTGVLSVYTGRRLTPDSMGPIYEVLSFMTGDEIYTHQIPRVMSECQPVLNALHPHLASCQAEAEAITSFEDLAQWLPIWEDRYGTHILVPRLNHAQHESIDPLTELAEKFRPEQIVTIDPSQVPRS